MADAPQNPVTPLGQALGRVPSGLYVLTVRHDGRAGGMLASWVQQAGFRPPMVTAAVAAQRSVGDLVATAGRFTLCQIPVGAKPLIKHFSRGFEPGDDPFHGMTIRQEGRGGPVVEGALAFLDVEVRGELTGGDHRVFLAEVVEGAVLDPQGEPFVHVRSNGFHY